MTNNQTTEMPEELWIRRTYATKNGVKYSGVEELRPTNNYKPALERRIKYIRADLHEALRAENERLKSLAYHKEGISYQAMFTAVIGMGEDADNWKEIADQLAGALRTNITAMKYIIGTCEGAIEPHTEAEEVAHMHAKCQLERCETALAAYRDMKGEG